MTKYSSNSLDKRYEESQKKWDETMWEKECAKNSYESAKEKYDFYDEEASEKFGKDIPSGNSAVYRKELKEDIDKKWEAYREATYKENEANREFNGYETVNPNTNESYHVDGVKDEWERNKDMNNNNELTY